MDSTNSLESMAHYKDGIVQVLYMLDGSGLDGH